MRLLFLLIIFISNSVIAQDKYWITFKDKNIQGYNYEKNLSQQTINNRIRYGLSLYQFTDVPLNKEYLIGLEKSGVKILNCSKWLNAVSAFLNPIQVELISALPYVETVSLIDRRIHIMSSNIKVQPEFYQATIKQLGAEKFAEQGLTGKGVAVGLIDAGFYKANTDINLAHLFCENRIKNQRDFLCPPQHNLVGDTINESDYHGRIVLRYVCGYDSVARIQMGLAVNSNFYLARTENEIKEYRGEEDNWIMAMEWMDSLGVRLINTSLGYSIHMDDPRDDYKKEEMNGKTAMISRAAQIATDEKGIFLVVSAGNDGSNTSWEIISAPADAEGVLSVGATKDKGWEKIGYSSIGPEFLPYLKPNVSCFSLSGTSYSAPAVTGFVACLMEKDPTIDNKELKKIVEKSGHLYPYGNNYIGYGVPQAGKALKLIEDRNYEFGNFAEKNVKGKKTTFKVERNLNADAVIFQKKNKNIVFYQYTLNIKNGSEEREKSEAGKSTIFHKKDETNVIRQKTLNIRNGKFKVRRFPGAERTTISIGLEVIEIIWQ